MYNLLPKTKKNGSDIHKHRITVDLMVMRPWEHGLLLILAVVWSVAAIGWYLLAITHGGRSSLCPGQCFPLLVLAWLRFWAVLLSCSALLYNYHYQRFQRHFYEVWFMPQAVAFIQCPSTFREYWKQRKLGPKGGWRLLRTSTKTYSKTLGTAIFIRPTWRRCSAFLVLCFYIWNVLNSGLCTVGLHTHDLHYLDPEAKKPVFSSPDNETLFDDGTKKGIDCLEKQLDMR